MVTDVAAVSLVATMAAHQSLSFFFSSVAVVTAQHSLVQDVDATTTVTETADVDATAAANSMSRFNRRGRFSCPAGKFTYRLNTYFLKYTHRLKQTKL